MANRTHKKRPRDPNQLGKMIVDISVGDIEDRAPTPEEQGKDELPSAEAGAAAPRAALLGQRGYPRSDAPRLPAKLLEPAGKPGLIVSSRKLINLLPSDQATTQSLEQDERLHHWIDEAITVPSLRAGLLKNGAPRLLAGVNS